MSNLTPGYFDGRASNWSDQYEFDKRFARRQSKILALLERHVFAGRRSGSALDFGCGSGVFSRLIARHGWMVRGIDASIGMIEAARKKIDGEIAGRVTYIQGTIDDIPGTYDLIVSLSVLEYIADDDAVLKAFVTALDSGGTLVLSVPNRIGALRRIEKMIYGFRKISGDRIFKSRGEYLAHQKHQYSRSQIDRKLAKLGMKKVEGVYLNAGIDANPSALVLLERQWWAAMYCGVYKKA